jgi:CheY-like chemotaxis protein
MNQAKRKILYVDDEGINLQLFKLNFRDLYDVVTAQSAMEGLQILANQPIDVIVSDLKMPVMDGIEFIERIKNQTPKKICILLTAYLEPDVMLKAINQELVFRYVTKPWQKEEVHKIIEMAFQKCKDSIEN